MQYIKKKQTGKTEGNYPIENFWSIFDRQLKNPKPLSNETELFNILNDFWQQLSHDPYQSLLCQMYVFLSNTIDRK